MFDPWCPTCAVRVLLTVRRLLRLEPTPTGHRAHLRCWCGTVVVLEVDRLGEGRSVRACALGGTPSVPGTSPTAA